MIQYKNYQEQYSKQMYDLFCEFRDEEDFFKVLTKEEFEGILTKNSNFKPEGTFLAFDGDKLVGFISGC